MFKRIMKFGVPLTLLSAVALAQQPKEEPDPRSLVQDSRTVAEMGFANGFEIRGSEGSRTVGFGSRLDEVVESAYIDMDFTASPALAPLYSHLKVYLNDELQKVVHFEDVQKGDPLSSRVYLNPKFFGEFNQVRIQLIGHLDKECWNPNDPSIWMAMSKGSRLHLNKRKLKLSNDLSMLPAPFFDDRDFRKLSLPIVFGPNFHLGTVEVAAMATSFFGAQADWREARFPVFVNRVPEQHAIVFVTNRNRPDFLRDFPQVSKPTLQMVSHPDNPYVKLLLIQGRDEADLKTAVRGLALGTDLFSGSVATVNEITDIKPREPYDAPNWVRTDRKIQLGELVDDPAQLQVSGRLPAPVKVNFAIPPDLFTWQSRGIPLELSYRYTPPVSDDTDSNMSFSVNGGFVEGFQLTTEGVNGAEKRVRIPLLEEALKEDGDTVRVPSFRVGNNNEMSFEFAFSGVSDRPCLTTAANNYSAVINPNSTLDFTGFPHYLEMPNLHAFATSAYPFIRMADLSDTVFVLPENPSKEEVETLLFLSGYFGGRSGFPGLNLSVVSSWDEAVLADKDILAIGTDPSLSGRASDAENLNLAVDASERFLRLPLRNTRHEYRRWRNDTDNEERQNVNISANGGFAAIVGRESPITSDRSMVAILAAHDTDFRMVQRALADGGKHNFMFGSVVTLRGDKVASYHVGDTYYVGSLPLINLLWYHLAEHPVLLAFASVLIVILLATLLWRIVTLIARRRVQGSK
ncbi:hypothetical protein FHR99_001201 [Litorivivens lipolytica]|uniref:Cyclic di-GMP-binding protein n=1 Tax=Litorivivens lipolytica TaxID=1524264 RepID=A0A7W4W435_9GAMM|nr:cellulose biosynthesis cyclic di-GMP-binding regulatory protein BcsB [Litorivivens lipolytica]MBB3046965.1 hypothetical protein [Litorivivens lipolytica]